MGTTGNGAYQHVYFSPHLDDVVLSCAGRIARQTAAGDRVLVVTVFAGCGGGAEPPANANSPLWAPFHDVAARRREDRRALHTLAADHQWLEFPDAIQRHRGYARVTRITAALPRREAPLRARVAASVAEVSRQHPAAILYFPLGVGNHVDHQLVAAVGLDRQRTGSPRSRATLFYEDTPYVCIPHLLAQRFQLVGDRCFGRIATAGSGTCPRDLRRAVGAAPELGRHLRDRGAVARILLFVYLVTRFARAGAGAGRRKWLTLSPEPVRIDAFFETKIAAIGCYRSQVRAIFGDLEELRRMLVSCSPGCGGEALQERCWRPVGEPDAFRGGVDR